MASNDDMIVTIKRDYPKTYPQEGLSVFGYMVFWKKNLVLKKHSQIY